MGGLLEQLSDELVALVGRIAPSVIALTGRRRDLRSAGSGFLVDHAGQAVTAWHVVEGLGPPLVATLSGGVRVTTRIVGRDPLTDLALLKLDEPPPAEPLELRTDPARLGELCLVVGSPFGTYPESVSQGVVSGLSRTIRRPGSRPIEGAIQTDAAINPGNSGGPLVDVRGRVLGVAASVDSRATGIGFAIAGETVGWVLHELRSHGRVVRAALGIGVGTRSFVLRDRSEVRPVVRQVTEGGPSAGVLLTDDVLLRVEGRTVRGAGDLHRILTRDRIGSPTSIEILRDGRVLTVAVVPTELFGTSVARV